jgi:hypothetical protein
VSRQTIKLQANLSVEESKARAPEGGQKRDQIKKPKKCVKYFF